MVTWNEVHTGINRMHNKITRMFRFLERYICLVLWMLIKKHISAIVYMAITYIKLLECNSWVSVQRSWECKGQICNLHPMRVRCSKALTSTGAYNWQAVAWVSRDTFLSCDKCHMDLITAKESNCKNKVHAVNTHYTV